MTPEAMIKKLETRLKPARFKHTLGVAETAREFARLRGLDEEKAYIAGLLHDCAKNYSRETIVAYCDEVGVALDEITRKETPLAHAPLGAYIAREEYKIEDEEILSAIYWHTVARVEMTPLEEIIYLADICEPGRIFEEADEVRSLVHAEKFDEAMATALSISIRHVEKKGGVLHPNSLAARTFYLDRLEKKL